MTNLYYEVGGKIYKTYAEATVAKLKSGGEIKTVYRIISEFQKPNLERIYKVNEVFGIRN